MNPDGVSVQVSDRVLSEWQRLVDDAREPSVLMLFSPTGDAAAAVHAVRDCVLEILAPRVAELEESEAEDAPWLGEWEWLGLSDGVRLIAAGCDLFEEMMGELVAALDRRGVGGVFDLQDWPQPPETRPLGHVLSCHLRVRGRRLRAERGGPPVFKWRPDLDAHAAVLATVDTWCKQLGGRAAYEITKATVGPITVDFEEDTAEVLREAFADDRDGRLRGATSDGWREIGVRSYVGRVGLAVGGADLEAGNWHTHLEELIALIRDNADLLQYAYVRRGSMPSGSLDLLDRDWPPRPDHRPRGGGSTNEAFEDVFAPDSFACSCSVPATKVAFPTRPATGESSLAGACCSNTSTSPHGSTPRWSPAAGFPSQTEHRRCSRRHGGSSPPSYTRPVP